MPLPRATGPEFQGVLWAGENLWGTLMLWGFEVGIKATQPDPLGPEP